MAIHFFWIGETCQNYWISIHIEPGQTTTNLNNQTNKEEKNDIIDKETYKYIFTKSTKSNVLNQILNYRPNYKANLPHKILKSKTEPPIIPQSAVKRKTDPPVVGSSMLMVPTVTGNIRIS